MLHHGPLVAALICGGKMQKITSRIFLLESFGIFGTYLFLKSIVDPAGIDIRKRLKLAEIVVLMHSE